MEPSRTCYLAGSLPFLFLGTVHALETPRRPEDRKGLSPAVTTLPAAMASSGLRLTSRTDMWRAWVGFNYSHGLGAVLFGLIVLVTGRSAEVFALEAAVMLPLAVAVALVYLVLGVRYWFRTPTIGIACSLAAFILATVLHVTGH